MNIHYALIGTHPEVQGYPLELAINLLSLASEENTNVVVRAEIEGNIAKAAEHFYGLSLADAGSIKILIDQIAAVEANNAVH